MPSHAEAARLKWMLLLNPPIVDSSAGAVGPASGVTDTPVLELPCPRISCRRRHPHPISQWCRVRVPKRMPK